MSAQDISRHAALLQLVADRLRDHKDAPEQGGLEACSQALESVAAALICERQPAVAISS